MPFEQYHEPGGRATEKTRTSARMCLSLIEEAEAIDWYEQRLALESDSEARATEGDIVAHGEEAEEELD